MKKRTRGHFCWSCGRVRPNERFSGRGHARHLCTDCQKLGAEELVYRQAIRDIDRMVHWEIGRVKRKQRSNFERFLRHTNERIRRYAEGILAQPAALEEDFTLVEESDLGSEDETLLDRADPACP